MPHLICAPQQNADAYLIDMDGTVTESPAQITDPDTGEKRLFFDLTGVSAGDHHVTVSAKNLWGQSNSVPFDFRADLPGDPSGVELSD